MSWVTLLWSMNASACLTLAAIYFLVWCQRRKAWDNLLFFFVATGITPAMSVVVNSRMNVYSLRT
jgi:hypothetical protein